MRVLVRGLAHLSRTIPANVTLIARIHTSNFRQTDQPSSNDGKKPSADISSQKSGDNPLREYFYRLPDPVLDDVQVEDFDGEIGPKTRVVETKAPDIYPDEDIEKLWKRLQDKFTEEDFEKLQSGDVATEKKFLDEVNKLWLTQGREEWEGRESELAEKLQDSAPLTAEELMGYIQDLGGDDPKRASDYIPNLSSRYTDLDVINEFSDKPLIDQADIRTALQTLNVGPQEKGFKGGEEDGSTDQASRQEMVRETDDLDQADEPGLQRYQLQSLRRTSQTGKGKMLSHYCLTVVGNGQGLVGLGEGKSPVGKKAGGYALTEAKRNMDYVDRFENRTIWSEMRAKFGGTRVIMRPRPVGFGLMCSPGIHQVLKAAGIKDCSVKIWGSRNPIISVKLVIKMLHAGHQPLYFGNGVGGGGVRLEKGMGMRNKTEVERERGRRIVDARLW